MDITKWNEDTEFVDFAYAEAMQKANKTAKLKQSTSYTMDDLLCLAHYMSTDGNYADHECVVGYKECLTPEGWVVFLVALTNACMMEEVEPPFNSASYSTSWSRPFDWFKVREAVLRMQVRPECLEEMIKKMREVK